MASPLGIGDIFTLPWSVASVASAARTATTATTLTSARRETSTARALDAVRASAMTQKARETKRAAPVYPAAVLELLDRILAALAKRRDDGLTAEELRATLGEDPRDLRRALAAGLREQRIRRWGAHSKVRYLLNA
jgi:hypothetical protein